MQKASNKLAKKGVRGAKAKVTATLKKNKPSQAKAAPAKKGAVKPRRGGRRAAIAEESEVDESDDDQNSDDQSESEEDAEEETPYAAPVTN